MQPEAAPKPEGEAPKEGEAKSPEGEAAPQEWAPVDYKFEVPEGMTLPEEALGAFKELGNKLKLTQEQATELMGMHTSAIKGQLEALAKAQEQGWQQTIQGWQEGINKDPDIGGSKTQEVFSTIGKALDEYGSKEARQAFDLTGAGWNPDITKFIYNMAKGLVNEGTPVIPGGRTSAKGKTTGQILYGDQ